uniref:Nucleolar protein 10 n=1 Tax=Theileria annulata TaxID=5874 RepID=A0A3B0N027_THEAN
MLVYSLSSGKSIPKFALEALKNKNKLKKNVEYEHRIELIHDLEFPQCCGTVTISPDLRYIIATGSYPPQIGIYDTLELCLKHRRGIDNEVIKTCFLASDYTKLAFLCHQRFIEFHNRGGTHYKIRVPREGTDMIYVSDYASLLTTTTSNKIYRVNLEKGMFEEPLESSSSSLNCLSNIRIFVSCGLLENWDLRTNSPVSSLTLQDQNEKVTACGYSVNGLKVAVGTEFGSVKLFDIRNSKPLWQYNSVSKSQIKSLQFINSINHYSIEIGENSLIGFCDNRSVRVHSIDNGNFVASIEGLTSEKQTYANINGFSFYPDTGICFIVGDQTRVGTYFIPHIGPAPTWCTFLENITEEMEVPNATNTGLPPKQQIYDEYVFVTKEQLDELSASDLIGTNMVKDYMHGFFIQSKLYHKLKSMNEFDYEEYKNKKLQERIESKRQMRVPIRQKPVKVNQEFAQKLHTKSQINQEKMSKKEKEMAMMAKAALEDERFAKIFTDENFTIEQINTH